MLGIERKLKTRLDSQLTIGELLGTDMDTHCWWEEDRYWRRFAVSLKATRELLFALGFRYEDGPFLQGRTRRRLIEDLMKNDKLGRRAASRVAEIAERRGWVSKLVG